jgi:hypothetical protein
LWSSAFNFLESILLFAKFLSHFLRTWIYSKKWSQKILVHFFISSSLSFNFFTQNLSHLAGRLWKLLKFSNSPQNLPE